MGTRGKGMGKGAKARRGEGEGKSEVGAPAEAGAGSRHLDTASPACESQVGGGHARRCAREHCYLEAGLRELPVRVCFDVSGRLLTSEGLGMGMRVGLM